MDALGLAPLYLPGRNRGWARFGSGERHITVGGLAKSNNFAANRLKGYFIADARVGWAASDSKYQLAAFVKNIFDKRYDTIGFDESFLTGSNLNSQGKPRWFGVNGRVNF